MVRWQGPSPQIFGGNPPFCTPMASRRLFVHAVALLLLVSAEGAPKVQLDLYYEALCPYCSKFIVNGLSDIFVDGILPIVDLQLFPYGNAKVGHNDSITCQHGPKECLLNTIEACAIHAWPDVTDHFKFIYCIEKLVVDGKYKEWETCFQNVSRNPRPIKHCFYSGFGNQLDLYYAEETDALEPPHKYVPWVVVDGRPLYDDYENFETEICKAYKGELPQACEKLVLKMSLRKKEKPTVRACYAGNAGVHKPQLEENMFIH